jgi:hypothetical protein
MCYITSEEKDSPFVSQKISKKNEKKERRKGSKKIM